ncbi:sulfatase [Bryobacterales bacterium F-183]|nr:sulfatase [Bryobacterales bacterium F-183]
MTRRDMLGMLALPAIAQTQQKKPNIIVIMADDMGFSDIGCYGSEIPTPNLDRLAANGVRLTQFYNAARCCPTRASLLTGLYPHQAGIGHMVEGAPVPAYQGYLNDKCATLAEVMKTAGYRTAMAGKWHVGEKRPHWPTDRGFERYFGLISGASSYFELSKSRQMALGSESYTPPSDGSFYMTNAFTDHALRFVDEFAGGKDPFLLYLAYTAPHWPLHALPEDIAKFRGKYRKGWDALREERHARQLKMGIVDAKWKLPERDREVGPWTAAEGNADDWDLRMAVYAAQIYRMDQNIGRLIQKLEETKQLDNTLILFLADNGGCAEEKIGGEKPNVAAGGADSYTSYGKPWAHASNTPFRMYKHWVHEGGISSPLIAHWPARLKKKGYIERTQAAHLIDIMATCMDAGGASYPAAKIPMEGKSMLPIFEGKRLAREFLAWEHEGNRALRQGDWKLVSKHPGGWELYNIAADRTETRDLAAAEPDRVRAMSALWEQWAAKCGVLPWTKVQELRRKA